jgi:quinol monooxygenase YgiN
MSGSSTPGEAAVLALNRFVVASERTAEFTEQARAALAALAVRPGYQGGELTRALDEPAHWCLVTRWASVGAYRRALGDFEVRVRAVPLLARSLDEPSAFEVLAAASPGGEVTEAASDRADGDPADRYPADGDRADGDLAGGARDRHG